MSELLNIASAILLCVGCFLVLWATISLARRRFFEPWLDKKQIIVALCCFVLAGIIFVPIKSSNRHVKQALSNITAAISRTDLDANTRLKATVKTTSGTIIAKAEYIATIFEDEYNKEVAFSLDGIDNPTFPKIINIFANNIQDTVYARVTENRHTNKTTTYTFEKGLKSIFAQKNIIIRAHESLSATTAFADTLKGFKKNGAVYQWVENYNIDKNGLNSFEIFFNGKDHEGKTVELIYLFELVK